MCNDQLSVAGMRAITVSLAVNKQNRRKKEEVEAYTKFFLIV